MSCTFTDGTFSQEAMKTAPTRQLLKELRWTYRQSCPKYWACDGNPYYGQPVYSPYGNPAYQTPYYSPMYYSVNSGYQQVNPTPQKPAKTKKPAGKFVKFLSGAISAHDV